MYGPALRTLRKYKSLRQYEMARRIGIGSPLLSGMESGSKKVMLEIIERYAKEFSTSVSSLIAFAEAMDGDKDAFNRMDEKMLRVMSWYDDTRSEQKN